MNQAKLQEHRFAYAIRAALNEMAGRLPPNIYDRLAAARQIALTRKKAEAPRAARSPALAMPGVGSSPLDLDRAAGAPTRRAASWLRRLGLLGPTLVLIAGLIGIYHWQQQQRVEELAEIDAALMLDELPPVAYADQGFHQYLRSAQ